MNIWSNTVITNKGIALLTKLTQGHTLNITIAEVGTGFVTPGLLAGLTSVTSPVQTLEFKPVSYPEDGVCAIPVVLRNDKLATGYKATQIGVYAEDPDDGKILFFIAQSVEADKGIYVPSAEEMAGYSAEWTFYLRYGQADGVKVVVDPTSAVSRAEMESYVNNAMDEKLVDVEVFMQSAQERLDKLDGREAFYAQNDEPTDAEEGSVWLDLDEGEGEEGDTIVGGFGLPVGLTITTDENGNNVLYLTQGGNIVGEGVILPAGGSGGSGGSVARISEITLLAANWEGETNMYSQVVAVDGLTENSQVDITPSVEQLVVLHQKDLTFVTENEGGVLTVYAIGQKPENDYTMQVTITEVLT